LLAVTELLRQIRPFVHCNSIYWNELLAPNRFTMTMNNCDSQALCTDKKSIRLNGLFYVWWCMSCIILRLQQQIRGF